MSKLMNKLEINLEQTNRYNTQLNELKENIEQIKNEKYPSDYSIQMIASKSNIFKSFDLTGKGNGNMTNWYLCNGRYNTPNLNNDNNDYKYIIYLSQKEIMSGIYEQIFE
jgi:hypothetical protein